jgi:hypothetical protein
LIKYIKSVLWRVAKRLSYIEDARCLKANEMFVHYTDCMHLFIIKTISEFFDRTKFQFVYITAFQAADA